MLPSPAEALQKLENLKLVINGALHWLLYSEEKGLSTATAPLMIKRCAPERPHQTREHHQNSNPVPVRLLPVALPESPMAAHSNSHPNPRQ